MFIKSFAATLAARALVVVPIGLLTLPAAHAQQQPNPQILDVQAGCFIRNGQAFNVLVKVGPTTTNYQFTFRNKATQQVALDQMKAMVNANTEQVPFSLPSAGTYTLSVKYGPAIANQTPVTSPMNIVVKPVSAVTLNGQKVCRESMTVPSDQQPARK